MRSRLSIAVSTAVAVSALMLAPSIRSDAQARDRADALARPVAPSIHRLSVAGVDAGSANDAGTAAPAQRAGALRAAGLAPDHLDQRPELLTGKLSVARFDAVGVSWDRNGSPAQAAVWARVRELNGWSDWNLLAPQDIGPDPGSTEGSKADRVATEPLLTNGADGVQLRIDAVSPLRNVRADLIDAGRSPADGRVAIASPRAQGLPSGSPAQPFIISRAQWGADESLRGHAPEYFASVKVGVIHHTVTSNSYSPASAYAEIRSIYAYHTQSLGWSDIAYNVLVDQYGQIFEGRYGGLDRPVLSAATGGFNTSTFSVSALGNFQDAFPSSAMVESIAQVLAWKLAISYVNPVGTSQLRSAGFAGSPFPEGQIVTFPNIIGHRDADYTACPGQYLYGELDAIRARVMDLTQAGLVHPGVETTPRWPGTNGSVHVTSDLLYGGDWIVEVRQQDGSLLTTYTGTGSFVDVTWPMTDQLGLPVPEGTYQIRIGSTQNGTTALDFNALAATSQIIGNLDVVQPTPNGEIAAGWVTASNGDTATAAVSVDSADPVRVEALDSRPDVAAAYPGIGPLHGFTAPLALTAGPHLVCLWGERAGLLSRPLACQHFDNPPNEPIGNVDVASPLYGGLRLEGWGIDRNTANSISTRFYVDGWWAGDPPAPLARPDVAGVYPAYGQNHGFDVSVNTGPGLHWVCVNGLNVGPGTGERLLRCVVLATNTGVPIGQFDQMNVGSGAVTVAGWTFDPDTTSPIWVHVYEDGNFVGAFVASGSRPDLSGPYPFMGTPHGYESTVGVSTVGHHTVCVYAINAGPPDQNPLVGCRSFG